MAEFPKLQKLIKNALKQSAEESSMLLGQDLTVHDTDYLGSNKMSYFSDMDDASFVVGVESREAYPGCFYMVFALRDAILMSGILLGIPPARISEKRKLMILEADDIDAFSEIANQIIGSFNSIFQPALPEKVHLKQLPPTKFIPQMDEITEDKPVADGEYLLCQTVIEMQGQEMSRIDLLIPLALAEMFDPQTAEPPTIEASAAVAAGDLDSSGQTTPQTNTATQLPAILLLDDDESDRRQVRKLLEGCGVTVLTEAFTADVAEILTRQAIKAVFVGMENVGDLEFSQCTKIYEICRKHSLPIIMCSGQWTRSGVLKAVKYGARDIIIKPYAADELQAKLSKFLDAA
jgi:CheY-like chemotaxis protein